MKTTKFILSFLMLCITGGSMFAQTVREKKIFDADWRFNLGDITEASSDKFDDSNWRLLNLPHDWSIEQNFDKKYASCTAYLPGGIGWYRKTFDVPADYQGKTVSIQFDGVYCNSEVWVNGHYLGKHYNGYFSFFYNITPYLHLGAKNVIAVRVDHFYYADTRWYSGSGIYRHVWLTVSNDLHVAQWGTQVSTSVSKDNSAEVLVKTTIANDQKKKKTLEIISSIVDDKGKIVATSTQNQNVADSLSMAQQNIVVKNPVLWDLDKPYLYSVKTQIYDAGKLVDECTTSFGIRTFVFDKDKGFFLNGKNIKLKGVCNHHDGGCVGAAVPEKVWRIRLEKLKAAGCNAVRTSHNPVAPEYLDLCDQLGFVVMDEAFDEWEYPKRKWVSGWNTTISGTDGSAPYFNQTSEQDLAGFIRRDVNHPSVIMWSIGNEIDYANDPYADAQAENYFVGRPDIKRMIPIAKRLKAIIKEIDTTRPVTMALANVQNSISAGLPEILDVVGYNYTEARYAADHAEHPNWVIYGSENPHTFSGWLAVKKNDFVCSQFLWTGVDYLGESNPFPVRSAYSGLLDLTGHEKPIYYWRQSLWSDKPMVSLIGRKAAPGETADTDPMAKIAWFVSEIQEKEHWNYASGDTVVVMAYSNCSEVELFLNGKSVGKKKYNENNSCFWWHVPFKAGEIKAIAKDTNGKEYTSYLKTVGNASKITLAPDVKTIAANGKDVAIVDVNLLDKDGNKALLADNRIDFELSGEGKIIGVDNGDAACNTNFQLPWRNAYQGHCIVIIQSTGKAGNIKLLAKSAGMINAEITIEAK